MSGTTGSNATDGSHRIRLTAAWEPPPGGVGPWRRSFGRPAGLGTGDRVWLVLEEPAAADGLALNGSALTLAAAGAGSWRADVTGLLRDRNELVMAFVTTTPAPQDDVRRRRLPEGHGEVFLEIVTDS